MFKRDHLSDWFAAEVTAFISSHTTFWKHQDEISMCQKVRTDILFTGNQLGVSASIQMAFHEPKETWLHLENKTWFYHRLPFPHQKQNLYYYTFFFVCFNSSVPQITSAFLSSLFACMQDVRMGNCYLLCQTTLRSLRLSLTQCGHVSVFSHFSCSSACSFTALLPWLQNGRRDCDDSELEAELKTMSLGNRFCFQKMLKKYDTVCLWMEAFPKFRKSCDCYWKICRT